MVVRVYLLAVKAPGISFEEFKKQWDVDHINLLREMAGDAYPQVWYHRYPTHAVARGPANSTTKFDGIGYLEFKDKAAFLKLRDLTRGTPENAAKLEAHERSFLDVDKLQMYTIEDEE
jgi:hypothetical protein